MWNFILSFLMEHVLCKGMALIEHVLDLIGI